MKFICNFIVFNYCYVNVSVCLCLFVVHTFELECLKDVQNDDSGGGMQKEWVE